MSLAYRDLTRAVARHRLCGSKSRFYPQEQTRYTYPFFKGDKNSVKQEVKIIKEIFLELVSNYFDQLCKAEWILSGFMNHAVAIRA